MINLLRQYIVKLPHFLLIASYARAADIPAIKTKIPHPNPVKILSTISFSIAGITQNTFERRYNAWYIIMATTKIPRMISRPGSREFVEVFFILRRLV
jgi:hypothetical protein